MTQTAVPSLAPRPAQPYLALPATVTMATLAPTLAPLLPRLFALLAARGIAPAGAPFWKYNVIAMSAQLQVEVGVPVAALPEGEQELVAGVLPAGTYATALYQGHPNGLAAATKALLTWAREQQQVFDVQEQADGEHWRCRLEEYLTDPAIEPNMDNWQTRLAIKLKD